MKLTRAQCVDAVREELRVRAIRVGDTIRIAEPVTFTPQKEAEFARVVALWRRGLPTMPVTKAHLFIVTPDILAEASLQFAKAVCDTEPSNG